ncbi:hypothetical protein H3V53_11715 [Paraburkholderia bengalensis]|uniref:Uncharacterized protein n=1 Tax=Paraburkholderia bengalensis TaxID=2747562 RepID=A0ABU8IQT4_9BURK
MDNLRKHCFGHYDKSLFNSLLGFLKHRWLVCIPIGVSCQKRTIEVALNASSTVTEHVLPLAQRLFPGRVGRMVVLAGLQLAHINDLTLPASSFSLSGQLAHEVSRCTDADAASVASLQGFRRDAIIAPYPSLAEQEIRVAPVRLPAHVRLIPMHLCESSLGFRLPKRADPVTAALLRATIGMVVSGIVRAALPVDVPLQATDLVVRTVDLGREALLQAGFFTCHPRDIRRTVSIIEIGPTIF